MKTTNLWIQQFPKPTNMKKIPPKHIIIKLLTPREKESFFFLRHLFLEGWWAETEAEGQ